MLTAILPPFPWQLRKPLIERKRRERINNCLDQLKETVVGAFHLDVSAHFYAAFCPFAGGRSVWRQGSVSSFEKLGMVRIPSLPLTAAPFPYQQSKLEKADILEMTVKHLQNIQSSKLMADSKGGLEAQQRYSTGYIQCMHEVHNLLLTCDWMDKTLGARLLNHLLKSLPRSGEDICKAALRSSSPSQQPLLMPKRPLSPKGSTQGTNPSQERFYPAENKASKNSFQLPSMLAFNQADAAPPRQVLQPNFSHNNPRMGSLDMWRPW
ncbi:transcription cofactor HES-6-like isoform X1 [Heliangelus exortis]|uniref:transcription cofactor HES-6-like isoform X1 n=1 Tax=Heliangelus exortis TaxID=472823 RepID=UPI003A8FB0D7